MKTTSVLATIYCFAFPMVNRSEKKLKIHRGNVKLCGPYTCVRNKMEFLAADRFTRNLNYKKRFKGKKDERKIIIRGFSNRFVKSLGTRPRKAIDFKKRVSAKKTPSPAGTVINRWTTKTRRSKRTRDRIQIVFFAKEEIQNIYIVTPIRSVNTDFL